MGRSDARELKSRLAILIVHMLKWQCQPERSGTSWRRTISEQRRRLSRIIVDSPGLKAGVINRLEEIYRAARLKAIDETGLAAETFPIDCPFGTDQILDPDFLPARR